MFTSAVFAVWSGFAPLQVWRLSASAGASQAQTIVNLQSTGGATTIGLNLAAPFSLNAGTSGLSATLPLTPFALTLSPGSVLTGVSCDGAAAAVSGNTVTLSQAPGLGGCVFSALNVVGATAASVVPFIARRTDFLLSTELGLDQQMDRFSDPGEAGDGAFQTSSLLTSPSSIANAGDASFAGGTRMGLLNGGSDTAPISFSASLQQMQKANAAQERPAPSMLGATPREPAPSSQRDFNIWAEGYWAWFDQDRSSAASDGHAGVLYAGADYLVTPRLLLGALIQYDDLEQDFDGSSARVSNTGWMAGPYAVVKLTDSIFFQGRAAWGQSDNEVRLTDTFTDRFDTERWLVKGRLLANLRSGSWLLRPSASVAYMEEDQDGYRSSTGIEIAHQTVSLGQAKFGPELSYQYRATGGLSVVPSLTLEGVWNFSEDHGVLVIDELVTGNDVRGRVEAGLTILSKDSFSIGASAIYDGIGDGSYESIGGRGRVKVPLN